MNHFRDLNGMQLIALQNFKMQIAKEMSVNTIIMSKKYLHHLMLNLVILRVWLCTYRVSDYVNIKIAPRANYRKF